MRKTLFLFFLLAAIGATAQEPVADTLAVGKCGGLFSVSPTMKVRFSPGNLQYQPSTRLCRFAAGQTEVIGWKPFYGNDRYKGWIDLFGWGTAMQPTNYSLNPEDYSFADWGFYCGLPTEGGKIWRTLTMDEWTYLLAKRPRARRLYALAYVEKHYGLILLPDGWKCPKGVYVKPGPKEDYVNWYTAEKWALLEAAGAVFLPCETKRVGTDPAGSASACHYWTASPNSKKADEALYILVDPYVPQARSAAKHEGMSVRLVQEVYE
ncbi:MAG: hypothetical protein J5641_04225 [Bacteroidales bacterium]|nr:hypothetical protein [Bacteroidales bacterium]